MRGLRHSLLLLIVCLGSTQLDAASQDASEAELKQLERAIAKARKDVAALDNERSALAADVEASEKAIRELQQRTSDLDSQLASEQDSLSSLQDKEASLEKARKEQQQLLAGYLRSAWMNGSEESLKLLLNQQDPAETARLMRYYRYFGAARAQRINDFNAMLQQLVQTRADIAAGTTQLALQQAELQQRQSELDGRRQQRQQQLAGLEAQLKAGNTKLNDLEQQRVEMQLLLAELTRSASVAAGTGEAFAARKGKLAWPAQGKVSHAFGSRYGLGDLNYEGVLLAARAGSDVQAVHAGRVVFADWFGNSGLLLIIDHGDGYMSLYAHNQQLFKPVGAWVESGEKIAAVGNTGGQSENGLYFEIRHNGKAENPAQWCKN